MCRIIQDCEEALTNWVEQNAAVKPKLSTRARTLSQRRKNHIRQAGEGVDLSGQDQPLEGRESGLWVPATEHQRHADDPYDEDEDDVVAEQQTADTTTSIGTNGESVRRGRDEERVVETA